jgi:hypothetical protein
MKRLSAVLLFLATCIRSSLAHPGIGIVMDSRGNVYYTDLKHVWKVATDGTKSIVVRNVHTHELYMDADDNLYGEHLWYEGEATDRWGHYVWRLSSDGTLQTIILARRGFLFDYNDFQFVRDAKGTSYWLEGSRPSILRRRSPDGTVSTIALATFENVRSMTVAHDGTIYVIDLYDLVRITPNGTITTLVRNLADKRRSFLGTVETHALMGVWTDRNGNIYTAAFSDRAVKRINPEGKVEIVFRAEIGWTPTGGMIASNGDMWLLEYSGTNAARARRVDKNGSSTIF